MGTAQITPFHKPAPVECEQDIVDLSKVLKERSVLLSYDSGSIGKQISTFGAILWSHSKLACLKRGT